MSNYTIEGNINFHEELYKLLDEDSEDEDTLCQITGLPLQDKSVILECNHHFNYHALYTEIYTQKIELNTYSDILSPSDQKKIDDSGVDYFIKCPYCRHLQINILPYYEELGLDKVYGINCLDKSLKTPTSKRNIYGPNYNYQAKPVYGDTDYIFNMKGTTFKWGQCCQKDIYSIDNSLCTNTYVSNIPNTDLIYCAQHYKSALMSYKLAQKEQIMAKKLAIKKEKEEELNQRKILFEEKNAERAAKGLPQLKRLPVIKKKVENVVEKGQVIHAYNSHQEQTGCNAILKTGPHKGKMCGCKILINGLCKRHSPKNLDNDDVKIDKNVK